jgi:hypothetical protein
MNGSPIKDQTNVLNQSVGFPTVSFFSPQTFLPVVTNLGIREDNQSLDWVVYITMSMGQYGPSHQYPKLTFDSLPYVLFKNILEFIRATSLPTLTTNVHGSI